MADDSNKSPEAGRTAMDEAQGTGIPGGTSGYAVSTATTGMTPAHDAETRLAHIEELLRQQLVQNTRQLRNTRARTIAVIAMAVFFVVAAVFITLSFRRVTEGVPRLIDDLDQTVTRAGDDMDEALATIERIDLVGINKVIGDVGKINFEALNTSIQGLAEAVENFRAFTELLRNPFGLGG